MKTQKTMPIEVVAKKDRLYGWILKSKFASLSSFDLAVSLISISTQLGVDKVEMLVKNTFAKKEATHIIATMNLILKSI